jgi:hypothetical protein
MLKRNVEVDVTKLRKGQGVRLYLGYKTDTEIHIREGIIIGQTQANRSVFLEKALELRVTRRGRLIREDPREVEVLHLDTGYVVKGRVKTEKVEKPYIRSYAYHCISAAEKI